MHLCMYHFFLGMCGICVDEHANNTVCFCSRRFAAKQKKHAHPHNMQHQHQFAAASRVHKLTQLPTSLIKSILSTQADGQIELYVRLVEICLVGAGVASVTLNDLMEVGARASTIVQYHRDLRGLYELTHKEHGTLREQSVTRDEY